jgi:hypothetical protein
MAAAYKRDGVARLKGDQRELAQPERSLWPAVSRSLGPESVWPLVPLMVPGLVLVGVAAKVADLAPMEKVPAPRR